MWIVRSIEEIWEWGGTRHEWRLGGGERWTHTEYWWGTLIERGHLKGLWVDGKVIDYIDLTQDKDKPRTFVNTITNYRVKWSVGIFLGWLRKQVPVTREGPYWIEPVKGGIDIGELLLVQTDNDKDNHLQNPRDHDNALWGSTQY